LQKDVAFEIKKNLCLSQSLTMFVHSRQFHRKYRHFPRAIFY